MRDAYLTQPRVTLTLDELERAMVRRRRKQRIKAALPLVFGVVCLALFCLFLLSETGHNFMVWVDAR